MGNQKTLSRHFIWIYCVLVHPALRAYFLSPPAHYYFFTNKPPSTCYKTTFKILIFFLLTIREGDINFVRYEDRFKERERSFILSAPEAKTKQQTFINVRKKEKLDIKGKKTPLKTKVNKNKFRSFHFWKRAWSLFDTILLIWCHLDITKSEFNDGIPFRYVWDPVKSYHHAHAI